MAAVIWPAPARSNHHHQSRDFLVRVHRARRPLLLINSSRSRRFLSNKCRQSGDYCTGANRGNYRSRIEARG